MKTLLWMTLAVATALTGASAFAASEQDGVPEYVPAPGAAVAAPPPAGVVVVSPRVCYTCVQQQIPIDVYYEDYADCDFDDISYYEPDYFYECDPAYNACGVITGGPYGYRLPLLPRGVAIGRTYARNWWHQYGGYMARFHQQYNYSGRFHGGGAINWPGARGPINGGVGVNPRMVAPPPQMGVAPLGARPMGVDPRFAGQPPRNMPPQQVDPRFMGPRMGGGAPGPHMRGPGRW